MTRQRHLWKIEIPFVAAAALTVALWSCGTTAPTSPSTAGAAISGAAQPSSFIGRFDRAVLTGAAASAPASLAASIVGNQVTLTWIAPSAGDPPTTYVVEAGSATGLPGP